MNEKEPEKVKGNGNWRHKIKELNLQYLSLVKLIANNHENPGYVRTALGLDQAQYEQLMNMSDEVIFRIADVGACLFRLTWNELKRADNLFRKDAERAAFAETRHYVPQVLAYKQQYASMDQEAEVKRLQALGYGKDGSGGKVADQDFEKLPGMKGIH